MSGRRVDNQRKIANRKRRDDAPRDLPPTKRSKTDSGSQTRKEDINKSQIPTNHEQKPSNNPATLAESQPTYDPGVDCLQSYYFQSNKLLFELNQERIQRSG